VDLESFTIAVLCQIEAVMTEVQREPGWRRLRQRGPAPTLADSEVLTMVVVGEFLGLDQDTAIVGYFRRDHPDWFPALSRVHRTTFTRQATFYGFRDHLRVHWPGLITAISLAPANVHDRDLVPEVVDGLDGWALGDRNYWDPTLTEELARGGITLLAPFKKRATDPTPLRSRFITQKRWRIETVASQLVERYHLKRVWARDAWHLTSRVLRKVLSHTIAVALCLEQGFPPLSFARLLD
jgi:hypothetical protein